MVTSVNGGWTQTYKKYKGSWVTLLRDGVTVVGDGKTLKAARRKAETRGHKETYAMFVPKEMFTFVGRICTQA